VNFDDCALHALDEQLADRPPIDRMRAAVGLLLDILPKGHTFLLCKECREVVRSMRGGLVLQVQGEA
jgi:hypothetical protein